ncbi:hypothetical protein HDU76_002915 [Blyttiomyces sp. JEL0837]|nr:hypothetical protein HDU76_002915 [Blyttiomyces sp. JEL0837]
MISDTATHEARNVKSLAYSLVASFLKDQGLDATYESFQIEAEQELVDARKQILSLDSKPLMAILEEYIINKAIEGMAGMDIKINEEEIWSNQHLRSQLQQQPFPTLHQTFESVHHSNILCIAYLHLPTSLFPSLPPTSSPKIPILATGSSDKSLRLTHAETGSLLSITNHQTSSILWIDVHPLFPHLVVTTGMDGAVHLVDLTTGNSIQSWKGHTKYAVKGLFSPGTGDWLVTASYDKSVNVYWNQNAGVKTEESGDAMEPRYSKVHSMIFNGAVESMTFIPTLNTIASPTPSPTLIIGTREDNYLHFITLTPLPSSSTPTPPTFPHTRWNLNSNNDDWVSFTPMDIAVSPTSQHLAIYTDSTSGRIIIYKIPSFDILHTPSPTSPNSTSQRIKPTGEIVRPLSLLKNLYGVDADGFSRPKLLWDSTETRIYATSDDSKIYLFDVGSPNGDCLVKLAGHEKAVRGVCLGEYKDKEVKREVLFSCSFDLSVRVWK